MKSTLIPIFALPLLLSSCDNSTEANALHFAISPEYPPFEYKHQGKLTGFDVELAQAIAKKLGMNAVFQEMDFKNEIMAVQGGLVDAAISTITITKQRAMNVDFSLPYHHERLGIIYRKNEPIDLQKSHASLSIGVQMGSTMQLWLNKHHGDIKSVLYDNNLVAIESLKAENVDGVLVDKLQADAFVAKNPRLSYHTLDQSEFGYGIATAKGSALTHKINQALATLKRDGTLQRLTKKYLRSPGGEA